MVVMSQTKGSRNQAKERRKEGEKLKITEY
jgi:hypothetical protein